MAASIDLLFALIVSRLIRIYTWRKYNAYIEIEWFAYNRSPAYDVLNDILTTLTNNGPNSDQSSYSNSPTDREITVDDCNDQNENDFGNSFLCKLLPIQIDCERGAFIIGNPKTPSLLVADFSQSSGIYDAFGEPKIHLETNLDYKETNLDTGARMEEENIINVSSDRGSVWSPLKNKVFKHLPFLKDSSLEDITEWHGLPRYPLLLLA
ncbi:941_t:CDS:2, partial [Entrophospora sp. SA101]